LRLIDCLDRAGVAALHAVGQVGLIGALWRISGRRQLPTGIGES
jgi:hypothetical protein